MASVAKREWVYKGQKKSAWVVRYEAAGKHPSRQFKSKKEADAFRLRVENELKDGLHAIAGDAGSVGQLAKRYLEAQQQMMKEGRLANGTFRKERFYFECHINHAVGDVNLADFSKAHADRFLADLRKVESKKIGVGSLRPATIKQIANSLARALDFAMRRGLVHRNVMREVGKWKEHRSGRQEPIRQFSPADVRKLIETIEIQRSTQTPRSVAFVRAKVYLGAFCGLRAGEIQGLTWNNVDFEGRMIRVRHSLDAWDNLKSPKTGAGIRDVPLPDMVAKAILAFKPFSKPEKRGLIFRTRTNGPLRNGNFHIKHWQPLLKAADLGPKDGRRFHFHALRHFYASMLIRQRLPLTDVAALLGHRSWDMTLQVYAHPTIEIDHRHTAVDGIVSAMLPAPVAQELRTAL